MNFILKVSQSNFNEVAFVAFMGTPADSKHELQRQDHNAPHQKFLSRLWRQQNQSCQNHFSFVLRIKSGTDVQQKH